MRGQSPDAAFPLTCPTETQQIEFYILNGRFPGNLMDFGEVEDFVSTYKKTASSLHPYARQKEWRTERSITAE